MDDWSLQVKNYLDTGGLFRPQYKDHMQVRDLIIHLGMEIERQNSVIDKLEQELKAYRSIQL